MANKLKTVPLRFSLSLGKLPPGRYNCQVTVIDPDAEGRVLAGPGHAGAVTARRHLAPLPLRPAGPAVTSSSRPFAVH